MMGRKFFCLVFLCVHLENFRCHGDDVCKNEPRCLVSRTHGMKSIDCFHKDFKHFPKCVPSDAEVLDLSFNRIRKVGKSDLSKFKYLKLLYLNDNFFDSLQNDTFEDLTDLISLDMSQNNIKRIPSSVFNLPSLDKLYLRQNFNLNMVASLENVKPIKSPISVIDISSTTEEDSASEFPDFGPMPYLSTLNISENRFQIIAPRHLAGLCNLQTLININVSNNYLDSCDCWIINKWLLERKVQFNTFTCSIPEDNCLGKELKDEDKNVYDNCLEIIYAIEKEHRVLKICIGINAAARITRRKSAIKMSLWKCQMAPCF
ncbi:slit homolog 3 protein isoform X2 [Anoplophora glabripennis]|uniref:slit homolog 3 protein isoform X2 n=1 Tax=Anoplophora glabripennis TaxID=217634 RepID=UPI0008736126|nr:slit homolog 3 protein isoform X2 [Anoplophora glabripennis]